MTEIENLKARIEKVEKNIHSAFVQGCLDEDYGQWSKADWEFSEVERLEKVKQHLEEQLSKIS
jgi:hypothetical protein